MNYIFSTILTCLRREIPNKYMRKNYFYETMNAPLNTIIKNSRVYVASNKEHKDFIQGFLVVKDNYVVYAYTRKAVRRFGVFKSLFKHHFKEWKKTHNCFFINQTYSNIFGKRVEYRPRG